VEANVLNWVSDFSGKGKAQQLLAKIKLQGKDDNLWIDVVEMIVGFYIPSNLTHLGTTHTAANQGRITPTTARPALVPSLLEILTFRDMLAYQLYHLSVRINVVLR
jgi:hypothetical protein